MRKQKPIRFILWQAKIEPFHPANASEIRFFFFGGRVSDVIHSTPNQHCVSFGLHKLSGILYHKKFEPKILSVLARRWHIPIFFALQGARAHMRMRTCALSYAKNRNMDWNSIRGISFVHPSIAVHSDYRLIYSTFARSHTQRTQLSRTRLIFITETVLLDSRVFGERWRERRRSERRGWNIYIFRSHFIVKSEMK